MKTDDFWPSQNAFRDISKIEQITDDSAYCAGIAICDKNGQPSKRFFQGEEAHFYYEFDILDNFEIPVGGIWIKDGMGNLIHGKDTILSKMPIPESPGPGSRLRFHQTVKLEIATGSYFIEVFLASVNQETYTNYVDGSMTFKELSLAMHEHCRTEKIEAFNMHLTKAGKLISYGLCNLHGKFWAPTIQTEQSFEPLHIHKDEEGESEPSIFHITHWKAGSQWIYKILRECVPGSIVKPVEAQFQFSRWPIQAGKVYPTVYVTKKQFESVRMPPNVRKFVVIRDLRDTLVSAYFSIKYSHPTFVSSMALLRSALETRDIEEGMIYLMDEWLLPNAQIQLSWLESGESLFHFEDIIDDDVNIFEHILIDECQLPVSRETLKKVVLANRFKELTEGRQRGQEDAHHHYRKGVSGDWRNYFTDRITRAFKARYGGVLIATGYEKNWDWESSENLTQKSVSVANNLLSSNEPNIVSSANIQLSNALTDLDEMKNLEALNLFNQVGDEESLKSQKLYGCAVAQVRRNQITEAINSLDDLLRVMPDHSKGQTLMNELKSLVPQDNNLISISEITHFANSIDAWNELLSFHSSLANDEYVAKQDAYYRKCIHEYGQFWRYFDIVNILFAASRLHKPQNYLEIGVRRGRSLCVVARGNPEVNITGFDLWIPNYAEMENPGPDFVRLELEKQGFRGKLELIDGDSHDTVPEYFEQNPHLTFDLITVDGDHSEEGAIDDLMNVIPHLSIGGILVFDDIVHPAHPYLLNVWNKVLATFPYLSGFEYTEIGYGIAFAIRRGV